MLEFTNKAFSRPNGRLFAYAPLLCSVSALLSPLRCSRTTGTLRCSVAWRLELTQNSEQQRFIQHQKSTHRMRVLFFLSGDIIAYVFSYLLRGALPELLGALGHYYALIIFNKYCFCTVLLCELHSLVCAEDEARG